MDENNKDGWAKIAEQEETHKKYKKAAEVGSGISTAMGIIAAIVIGAVVVLVLVLNALG